MNPSLTYITKDELRVVARFTQQFAALSKAHRLKVGAVVWDIRQRRVISIGYNGTPSGESNRCERTLPDGTLQTVEQVIHAEDNCLRKLSWWERYFVPSVMIITHAPCLSCARKILATRSIRQVLYLDPYRDLSGVRLLSDHISTHRILID